MLANERRRARRIAAISEAALYGRGHSAEIGAASRAPARQTAIGDRERARGANLRPRPQLLSHRELVFGPFVDSKRAEADRPLRARATECGTHYRQAQRHRFRGAAAAFQWFHD